MSIPINRKAWSVASQRSLGQYDERATEYEGISCRCKRCEKSFVLTAEEQQYAYEVIKKYVWWIPKLCRTCSDSFVSLRARDREFQSRWNTSREILKGDLRFISEWHQVLEEMTNYGSFNSMRVHLGRLLEADAS
jgi:hypothetical protein